MKTLEKYINGLKRSNTKEPVFFLFHSEIGRILTNDEDPINSSHTEEKVLPNSAEIPLLL